jgi:hypothetical protein
MRSVALGKVSRNGKFPNNSFENVQEAFAFAIELCFAIRVV